MSNASNPSIIGVRSTVTQYCSDPRPLKLTRHLAFRVPGPVMYLPGSNKSTVGPVIVGKSFSSWPLKASHRKHAVRT